LIADRYFQRKYSLFLRLWQLDTGLPLTANFALLAVSKKCDGLDLQQFMVKTLL
jgi:hypothetical protein